MKKSKEILFIFLILLAAFALRIYRLGFADLWYDEVFSILSAQSFLDNWNPPLYFAVLNCWIKLFGTSEFALRFPSVIFSVLSVFFTFLIGRFIINARVGFLAGILMSFSAFSIWYAQEARPYSFSLLLGVVSTYCLLLSLMGEKKKYWLYFILFSIFLLYSDITHFSLIFLFAQLLSAIIFFRDRLKMQVFYFLAVILAFSPRIGSFISKLHYVQNGFWIPAPTWKSLIFTLENFNAGYNVYPSVYLISIILSFILLISSILFISAKKELVRKTAPLFIITFLPIFLIFLISKIYVSIYLDRGMLILVPYYYILLASGTEYYSSKKIKVAIISLSITCFFIGAYGYHSYLVFSPLEHHIGVHLKRPIKPVVEFIKVNFGVYDKIAHTNLSTLPSFNFYWGKNKINQGFLFVSGMVDSNSKRPFKSKDNFLEVNDINLDGGSRLWVVSCDWPREGPIDENSITVNEKLNKRFRKDLTLNFDGLWVFRYVK